MSGLGLTTVRVNGLKAGHARRQHTSLCLVWGSLHHRDCVARGRLLLLNHVLVGRERHRREGDLCVVLQVSGLGCVRAQEHAPRISRRQIGTSIDMRWDRKTSSLKSFCESSRFTSINMPSDSMSWISDWVMSSSLTANGAMTSIRSEMSPVNGFKPARGVDGGRVRGEVHAGA